MVKNIDIAYKFGKVKTNKQISVGFAVETNDELKHAIGKLDKKNFDMIVLNPMNDVFSSFKNDTNKITIIKDDFSKKDFLLKNKSEAAKDIVNEITVALSANKYQKEKGLMEYETKYR